MDWCVLLEFSWWPRWPFGFPEGAASKRLELSSEERGGCGPEHRVDEDADTEGVKHGIPPGRIGPRMSGLVSVQEEGREDVQPAESSTRIAREGTLERFSERVNLR